jgi:hypothetical protein
MASMMGPSDRWVDMLRHDTEVRPFLPAEAVPEFKTLPIGVEDKKPATDAIFDGMVGSPQRGQFREGWILASGAIMSRR